jgi:hypothetical protein
MKRFAFLLILALLSCSGKDKYDPARYVKAKERNELLTSIIAYLYVPPQYVSKQDRFKPEHRNFYSALIPKFPLEKLFVADDGTYYYLVIRPANSQGTNEVRGAGGHFKIKQDNTLTDFREVFVTPLMTKEEAQKKASFLFDEMVKGDVQKYLKMQSYVQWPNAISEYDTVSYEWKLKEESVK